MVFFKRNIGYLIIIYIIVGVIPFFVFEDSQGNVLNGLFKYLTLPVAVCIYFLLDKQKRRWFDNIKLFISSICVSALFLLVTYGNILGANCLVGKQEEVLMEGVVIGMSVASSAGLKRYTLVIENSVSHLKYKVLVNNKFYRQQKIGRNYSQVWMRGPLGILYIYRHKINRIGTEIKY